MNLLTVFRRGIGEFEALHAKPIPQHIHLKHIVALLGIL
jgi:hypothetical protein